MIIIIFSIFFPLIISDYCDSKTSKCIECPLNFYRQEPLSQAELFFSACLPKKSTDFSYEKTFYIRNIKCENPDHPSMCIGTRTDPFDSIISTLIKIHNEEFAERFFQQKIQLILIGSPHYLMKSDLIYDDMRFFRMFNASIEIRPLYCEEEVYEGCPKKNENEFIDIILKTSSFSFEIYGNFSIYNIRILGNDIVLEESECLEQPRICCHSENFNDLKDNCSLIDRITVVDDLTRLTSFRAMFALRVFLNEPYIFSALPTLNLVNFHFNNTYSTKGSKGWLTIILLNSAYFDVSIRNSVFADNMLPYGYLCQLEFSEDPYYKILGLEKKPLELNSKSSFLFENILIQNYNSFNVKEIYGVWMSSSSIFKFSIIENSIKEIVLSNISIHRINLLPSSYKFCFSFVYLDISKNISKVNISKLIFREVIGLGMLEIKNYIAFLSQIRIDNINKSTNDVISVQNDSILYIEYSFISRLTFIENYFLIISEESLIIINQASFENLKESICFFTMSSIIINNTTFEYIYLNQEEKSMFFYESNLTLTNSKILNSIFPSSFGNIFFFYIQTSLLLIYRDSLCYNVTSLKIFEIQAASLTPRIDIANIELIQIKGVRKSSIYFYFFVVHCEAAPVYSAIMDNLFIHDCQGVQVFFVMPNYNVLVLRNIRIINYWSLHYYVFILAQLKKNLLSLALLQNITIENVNVQRAVPMLVSEVGGNLTIIDFQMKNITTTESFTSLNQPFYAFEIFETNIVIIKKLFLKHESLCPFFKIAFVQENINVEFIDSEIYSNLNLKSQKFQVFSVQKFVLARFENNKIFGMFTNVKPNYINDETGVITFSGSDDYEYASKNITVIFKNNKVMENVGIKYGVVGFVGVSKIYLSNCSFFNNTADSGGTLVFYYIDQAFLENINIYNSTSLSKGGTIFLTKINFSLSLENANFYLSRSFLDGGLLYVSEVMNLKFFRVHCFNTFANEQGGMAYIINTNLAKFENISIDKSYSYAGGMFYLDQSKATFLNGSFTKGIVGSAGGFIYILGLKTQILITFSNFSGFYSAGDGGIISSANIDNLTVSQVEFACSKVKEKGIGIINIEGFFLPSGDKSIEIGIFVFENVSFLNNSASFGANVFFSSNNILIIKNIISKYNKGSLFTIETDLTQVYYFENLTIEDNNNGHNNVLGSLFIIYKATIFFRAILTKVNFGRFSLFAIYNSIISLSSSIIEDYFTNEKEKFFSISFSKIYFSKNKFSYSKLYQNTSTLFNVKKSIIYSKADLYQNFACLDMAALVFDGSHFYSNGSYFFSLFGFEGALYLWNSNLTILNAFFERNGNSYELNWKKEQVSDITFEGVFKNSLNVISILNASFVGRERNMVYIANSLKLEIKNTVFLSSNMKRLNQSFNRALFLNNIQEIVLMDIFFQNFKSELGSCLIVISLFEKTTFMLNSTIFLENIAFSAPALYVFGQINLIIYNSTFQNNQATKTQALNTERPNLEDSGKGGCIIIDCEYFEFCKATILFSSFLNNFAELFGPTILSKTSISLINNQNFFKNNKDLYEITDSFFAFPPSFHLLNEKIDMQLLEAMNNQNNIEKSSILINYYFQGSITAVSGKSWNLTMILVDSFNQLLSKESRSTAELKCFPDSSQIASESGNKLTIDKGSAISKNGIFSFDNIKIIYKPNSSLLCTLKVNYPDSLLFKTNPAPSNHITLPTRTLSLDLQINIRKCIVGELYMEDESCLACIQGKYSLIDPIFKNSSKECLPCPENSYCKGGKYITPLEGFWRANEKSELIVKCVSPKSCLGVGDIGLFNNLTEIEKAQGVCGEHNWGNVCFYCKYGYARFKSSSECEECGQLVIIYVKIFLSLLFIVVYIAFQVRIFSRNKQDDPHLAVLMKLFLNHFQNMSLVNLIDIGWAVNLDVYLAINDYLSFITQDFFAIDCFAQNTDQNLLLQKIVFTTVLPILLSIFMALIWFLVFIFLFFFKKSVFHKKLYDFLFEKMRITLIILIFILYPEILRKCFSLFNCTLIDDNESTLVLVSSPNIICWAEDHKYWVMSISLPGLIFWGVLAPFTVFFILKKYQDNIMEMIYEIETKCLEDFTKGTTQKIKTKTMKKNIIIDMEKEIALKIFPNGELPPIHTFGYQYNHMNIIATVEYHVLNRNEMLIQEEILFNRTDKTDHSITDGKNLIPNKEIFITNPRKIYKFLPENFVLQENITEQDLRTYLMRIRIYIEKLKTYQEGQGKKIVPSQIKSKKKVKVTERTKMLIKNLGFLFPGYKKEYYYWEIVIFSRKFCLILVGMFNEFFPTYTKPAMFIIVISFYTFLQIMCRPYQFAYMNNLELGSLISTFFCTNIFMLIFSDKMTLIGMSFLVGVFSLNFIFIIFWLHKLFLYGKLGERIKHMRIFFKSLRQKMSNSIHH